MSGRVCPVCGRQEANPSARFCDEDGAKLVPGKETRNPAPRKETSDPAPGRRAAFPWWLLLCVLGVVLICIALWLALSPPPTLDTGKTEVEFSTTSKRAPGPGGEKREGAVPPAASTPRGLLARCYGKPAPDIPRVKGDSAAEGFEVVKDITRIGTGVLVNTATPPLSLADERRVGDKVARALEQKYGVSNSDADKRLQRVVGRLVRVAPRHKTLRYRFRLLRSPHVNAFMAPGGRGFVFEGLLEALPDDSQLAFIIGHELAHSELKHNAQSVRVALAGRKLGEALAEGSGDVAELLSGVTARLLQISYDQDLEYEADRLGLCLAVLAGYRKEGGRQSFVAMGRLVRGRRGRPKKGAERIAYDVLESHPPLAERARDQRRLGGKIKGGR